LLFDPSSLGVNGECLADHACPCMSLVDDTDLRFLVQSWKQLPEPIRSTIMTLVRLQLES
jgi:hypothetical protein